jgi:membrane protease YdiL (CAAX protease family)
MGRSRRRPGWEEWTALSLVVVYNPLVNTVIPDAVHVPSNLSLGAVLAWLALRAGATPGVLGLGRDRLRHGLALGAAVGAAVALAVALLLAFPAGREALGDDRFVPVGTGEALVEVLVRIPLATALGEEVIFRAVLLGLLLRRFAVGRAVLLSALVFGLWHIAPTLVEGEGANAEPAAAFGAVAGAVAATIGAGVAFAWLRLRSGSILAPVLVHWAINGSAYLAGWLVVSGGWV